jgi:hypothetical protein
LPSFGAGATPSLAGIGAVSVVVVGGVTTLAFGGVAGQPTMPPKKQTKPNINRTDPIFFTGCLPFK